MTAPLSPTERAGLLGLARAVLVDRLHGGGALDRALEALEIGPALAAGRAVFVTLRERSDGPGRGPLRGCIGTLGAERPLYRNVIEAATSAAFDDPRFSPLGADELARVQIEISALTPLSPVADPQDIVLGRDGVDLRRGGKHALFLPQVAIEQRWDVGRLLEQLALKAGLARTAWREAQLSTFQAEVFGEGL